MYTLKWKNIEGVIIIIVNNILEVSYHAIFGKC